MVAGGKAPACVATEGSNNVRHLRKSYETYSQFIAAVTS